MLNLIKPAAAFGAACLFAAALCAPAGATAANKSAQARSKPPALIDDFRGFAADRPRDCGAVPVLNPPPGWRAGEMHCAWRNLLQVQHYHALPRAAASFCTGPAARWWAWSRARMAVPAAAAWRSHWSANALVSSAAGTQRIALIRQQADGAWSATEWRWTPSERVPTRRWQQGRWDLLAAAVRALQPAAGRAAAEQESTLLLNAWQANLKGRAGEADTNAWRWQGNGTCMVVDTVGLSVSQLPLPYEPTEARLEQRAAMQLLLARRYPQADWLTQFSLLAPGSPAAGAKYVALWMTQRQIRGQLWMPRKNNSTVRLRISAPLPPSATDAARSATVFRAARAVNDELRGIAGAWEAIHER